MKALLIWFGTLAVLLSVLGLLVGAQERRPSRPAEPSIYTDALEPELPTATETQLDVFETHPALTF